MVCNCLSTYWRRRKTAQRTSFSGNEVLTSCIQPSDDSTLTVEDYVLPVLPQRGKPPPALSTCQGQLLFSGCDEEVLTFVASKMKLEKHKRSAIIMAQGDEIGPKDKLCIVVTGSVTVHVYGSRPFDLDLGQGSMFGEVALLFGASRNATVISKGCTLYSLRKDTLQSCVPNLPFARLLLFLRKQILLQNLNDAELTEFATKIRCEKHAAGSVVIEEGQQGHTMYIVRRGRIAVWRDTREVAVLGRTSVLGQRALHGKRRTATCVAVDDVEVVAIDDHLMDSQRNPLLCRILCCDAVIAVQQHSRVFGSFNAKQMESLLRGLTETTFQQGDTIIEQGEAMTSLWVVRTGCAAGRAVAEAGGFQYFGSITGHPCPSSVVVESDRADVVCCSRDWLVNILQSNTNNRIFLRDLDLGEEVGAGTSGKVRRATSRAKPDKVYAVKTIAKSRRSMSQVYSESAIMTSLAHPFCVRLFNIEEDEKEFHLIMEFVSGGELFQQLQFSRKFPLHQTRFYIACVVLALEYLHRNGIVYRDLKPENLLLDERGYLKLADFGFAKRIGNQRTFTLCGTPEYQAPEIMAYRGATITSDFWSLGVLLYELLTGVSPFVPVTSRPHELVHDPWNILRNAQSARYKPPPGYENTPAHELITQLLEPDPDLRLSDFNVIKQHPWYAGFDWKALASQRMQIPFKIARKK